MPITRNENNIPPPPSGAIPPYKAVSILPFNLAASIKYKITPKIVVEPPIELQTYYSTGYLYMNPVARLLSDSDVIMLRRGLPEANAVLGRVIQSLSTYAHVVNEIGGRAVVDSFLLGADIDDSAASSGLVQKLLKIVDKNEEAEKQLDRLPERNPPEKLLSRGDGHAALRIPAFAGMRNADIRSFVTPMNVKFMTQQLFSTSGSSQIVATAEKALCWVIATKPDMSKGRKGGNGISEEEVLFPSKTNFMIRAVICVASVDQCAALEIRDLPRSVKLKEKIIVMFRENKFDGPMRFVYAIEQ